MKRISIIVVAGLAVALLAYAQKRTTNTNNRVTASIDTASQQQEVRTAMSAEKVSLAQTRVNRYFLNTTGAPKLKDCWSRLKGEGMIAMDFTYRKSGGSWAFEKVAVTKSNLPKGQDAIAVQCLQDSLRTTSFSIDTGNSREQSAGKFVVRWTWPVPLPTTGTQLMARMSGGSGGLGDVAGCSECVTRSEYPYGLKCESRKSGGYIGCQEKGTNTCAYGPATCLTGTYGMAGGVVMY